VYLYSAFIVATTLKAEAKVALIYSNSNNSTNSSKNN